MQKILTMKKYFLFLIISFLAFQIGHSQTNVSGGIYANTTWTLANSPYVVVGNVVVFPGNTLTIEPGVVVKFYGSTGIEMRQAKLIAIGTSTDSITFTSNDPSPTPGNYTGIYLNLYGGDSISTTFYYCNFLYADNGIHADQDNNDTLFIKNSNFNFNNTGLYNGDAVIDSCNFTHNTQYGISGGDEIINHCNISYNSTGIYNSYTMINNSFISYNQTGIDKQWYGTINNCIISHNQTGINSHDGRFVIKYSNIDSNNVAGIHDDGMGGPDSVMCCQIKYNGIGISISSWYIVTQNVIEYDSIGIRIYGYEHDSSIYCNRICNNSAYDLEYFGTNNIMLPNNYWCTTDSASTETVIYDGYDDISYGLVSFMPIDTLQCYLTTGINFPIGSNINSFEIYPNPFSTEATIHTANIIKTPL